MKNGLVGSILIAVALSAGCASVGDTMTPSLQVNTDAFDGSLRIFQTDVFASKDLGENGQHTLGFEWNKKFPDTVFITVGVRGVHNVTAVEFNIDGKIISNIKTASSLTEYAKTDLAMSTRRFQMPIADFVALANGADVKMKAVQIDGYTVSSFGSGLKGSNSVILDKRFKVFLQALREHKAI